MQVRTAKPEGLPSGEALLLDYAERLAKYLPGRRAVHVHLAELQPLNRREQHLRMAASAFDPLVRRAQGQNFRLSNGDLVVVVKDVTVAEIDDVVLRLRFMFGDDPLVHVPDDALGQAKFCDWYDLERQYPAFLALAQARHRQLQDRKEPERPSAAPAQAAAAPKSPLDPLRLSRLEAVIATTDVKPLLRRRAIAELPPAGGVRPIGTELGLSLELLGQKVMPDVNLAADRSLLAYLNAVLDRRLVGVLAAAEGVVPLPSWIGFAMSTLMAPEFVQLDDKLRVTIRKTMVAQIRWEDALRDVAAFIFLRDFLKARKWQVALDGLSAANFALIDRATLEPDYVKLAWDQNAADATPSRRRAAFLDALEQSPPGTVVLADCSGPEAVQFGRSAGVTLYEGRAVDALLQQRVAATAS
jgi:hypothetical protein